MTEEEGAFVKLNVSSELLKELRARHPEWSPKMPAVFVVDSALRILKEFEEKQKTEVSPVEQQ